MQVRRSAFDLRQEESDLRHDTAHHRTVDSESGVVSVDLHRLVDFMSAQLITMNSLRNAASF